MARRLISPELILPTRMILHIPTATPLRFSVLDFPYAEAVKTFIGRFKEIYQHQRGKDMPHDLNLPYRRLNDALLALAPSLIQAFEGITDHSDAADRRMAVFTRSECGMIEDFPSIGNLRSLIRHWLEQWGEQPDVRVILQNAGKGAWQAMMSALDGDPETGWQHNIDPASLADDLSYGSLAFMALPALLTALLHGRKMIIQSVQKEIELVWRRANDGGKQGLHLVSQPIPYGNDYFAYRLDFSVQTQAGHFDANGKLRPWIFAHLSIQRYITERYRGGDKHRNISILVGCNRERFNGGWEHDTTLIRLSAEKRNGVMEWATGVGSLLDDFAVRKLISPEEILADPFRCGSYGGEAGGDEYYVVYAEGRKFGNKRERGNQIKTGTTLRERSQIMDGVLALLDGWLEVSKPLRKDAQNPQNTLALRDYDHMVKPRSRGSAVEYASWRTALKTSLEAGGYSHLYLVVLYRSSEFRRWAENQVEEALMEANEGDNPLVTVAFKPLESLLYAPLDPGDLDPQIRYLPPNQRPPKFMQKWKAQMRASYGKKREEWCQFLRKIDWPPNARRMMLIDSTGEPNVHDDQKIKGAVRDACHRENILSQFIVGNLVMDKREKFAGRLDGHSRGRLKNAVLDLLVRQQGILYAPPREIYERAANIDEALAGQLDVIAFCRVQRAKVPKIHYALAVRLRAGGEVDVMLPGDTMRWIPYAAAAHEVGMLFSEQRPVLFSEGARPSPLRLGYGALVNFVYEVLTKHLECPTIAVIEADVWRNARGANDQKQCWTQLSNGNLFRLRHVLQFDNRRVYDRAAPALDLLLGVVRLRMNDETPQYITAGSWMAEETMRDIPHLTGYVDTYGGELLHYMSAARLPEMQKGQKDRDVVEAFKMDIKINKQKDIAIKHSQLIEMVPFFVHPRFQSEEGQRQLCRCIHFLRISPAFTMGDIALPYPMHLGEKLIEDQFCIVNANA